MKTYYEILEVNIQATQEEIKIAYRKLAHIHHPDKGGDAEKFKQINEAYQTLGNTEKRRKYDYSLQAIPRKNYSQNFYSEDIYNENYSSIIWF